MQIILMKIYQSLIFTNKADIIIAYIYCHYMLKRRMSSSFTGSLSSTLQPQQKVVKLQPALLLVSQKMHKLEVVRVEGP